MYPNLYLLFTSNEPRLVQFTNPLNIKDDLSKRCEMCHKIIERTLCCVCQKNKCHDCFRKTSIPNFNSEEIKSCKKCNKTICFECAWTFKVKKRKCRHCDKYIFKCSHHVCICGEPVINLDRKIRGYNGYIPFPEGYQRVRTRFGYEAISKYTKCCICKENTIHEKILTVSGCCDFSRSYKSVCCKKECENECNKLYDKEYSYPNIIGSCSKCESEFCVIHSKKLTIHNGFYYCTEDCLDEIKEEELNLLDYKAMISKKINEYDGVIEDDLFCMDIFSEESEDLSSNDENNFDEDEIGIEFA